MEYTRTTGGTIFSADVQISGGEVIFYYKPLCIPLEAKASKKLLSSMYNKDLDKIEGFMMKSRKKCLTPKNV